jgi:hypothetical protein
LFALLWTQGCKRGGFARANPFLFAANMFLFAVCILYTSKLPFLQAGKRRYGLFRRKYVTA